MQYENEFELKISAIPENEGFARTAVAAFATQLNPTLTEINDIKLAVSEAVTNAVLHGYDNMPGKNYIYIKCRLSADELYIEVMDKGKGIEDIERARQPLFSTKADMNRAGLGIAVMEAFMDRLEIISEPQQGTCVRMYKKLQVD